MKRIAVAVILAVVISPELAFGQTSASSLAAEEAAKQIWKFTALWDVFEEYTEVFGEKDISEVPEVFRQMNELRDRLRADPRLARVLARDTPRRGTHLDLVFGGKALNPSYAVANDRVPKQVVLLMQELTQANPNELEAYLDLAAEARNLAMRLSRAVRVPFPLEILPPSATPGELGPFFREEYRTDTGLQAEVVQALKKYRQYEFTGDNRLFEAQMTLKLEDCVRP